MANNPITNMIVQNIIDNVQGWVQMDVDNFGDGLGFDGNFVVEMVSDEHGLEQWETEWMGSFSCVLLR